eukprot:842301-Rhodomonas_salina.1
MRAGLLLENPNERTCAPNVCGDGFVGNGEPCDDGNLVDGDGCSSFCVVEDFDLCDLAQACGPYRNVTCESRQSTFFKWNDPPTFYAVDPHDSTCMRTADAVTDTKPQWWRVDLSSEEFVGTIRITSAHDPADLVVAVAMMDAEPQALANPSVGSPLPDESFIVVCSSAPLQVAANTFEMHCASGAKGRY